MDDNKITTQDVATATTSNNEVNAGKSFTQTDMNNLASKIRGEEKAKTEELIRQATANAIAEYERQAKLTQEEKDREAKTKREAELREREKAITLRERRIEAQELLAKQNIPIDLVDFVVDLDESKTRDNIDKLAKTYNKSVETGVTDKLKGQPPKDFSSNSNTDKPKKVMSAF